MNTTVHPPHKGTPDANAALALGRSDPSPRCTVIVPVFNGIGTIERCLQALLQQNQPAADYEVIIVDDGSTDGTATVVDRWIQKHAGDNRCRSWRCVRQSNGGPGAARNHGARLASAPVLLFTDADCAPTEHWVEAMMAAFDRPDVMGAKGTYLTDQTDLVPSFVQVEYEDRYDRMQGLERIDFVDTYSAAYRKEIFLENGGFDTTFTTASVEDQELSFRLASKGYRLVFAPEAQVKHLHDRDLSEYFRRKYAIGFWKALLTQWHPERVVQDSHTPQTLKIQMLLWAGILALLPVALLSGIWPILWLAWIGLGFLFVIFLLSSLPFLAKLDRQSRRLALIGPGMLAVRSVALGLGYLVGTIRFAGTPPGVPQPIIPWWKQLLKRLLDIGGALVGLLISAPLILIAAVAIKFDSPGPIFYVQTRIGEHGRPFRIIKLRSMQVNADQQLEELIDLDRLHEPAYKLPADPRITRVGRFLRRSSLDELPQFWNVLRGDMSLVGPRPEDARVVALYSDQQRRRLLVKPGITGPMQVNGRGDLPFSTRLQLEIDYIENYSLLRDLLILLRTLPVVWQGRGAR